MGILSSIAGAAFGGLLGGKDKTQTVDNTPQIVKMFPKETEKLGSRALEIAQKELDRPYEPLMPFVQATANTDPWNAQFDNPEMIQYQNIRNAQFADANNDATTSTEQAKTALEKLRNEVIGRQYFSSAPVAPGTKQANLQRGYIQQGYNGDISNEDFERIGGLLTSGEARAAGVDRFSPEVARHMLTLARQ